MIIDNLFSQCSKFLKTSQFRSNYDYGEGLYSNLDEYKSVLEFRKRRRNKRKKEIKKIKEMHFK